MLPMIDREKLKAKSLEVMENETTWRGIAIALAEAGGLPPESFNEIFPKDGVLSEPYNGLRRLVRYWRDGVLDGVGIETSYRRLDIVCDYIDGCIFEFNCGGL